MASLRRRLTWGSGVIGGLLSLALLMNLPWPLYYRQTAITAHIVDSRTGRPIEGAAAVALWVLSHGGLEETWSLLRYQEGVSDAHGTITFAAWTHWRRLGEGRLKDQDPEIVIYKPGYRMADISNRTAYIGVVGLRDGSGRLSWTPRRVPSSSDIVERYPGWRWGGATRYCYWNGRDVPLRPSTNVGDLHEDNFLLPYLMTQLQDDQIPHFRALWRVGHFEKDLE